MAANKSTKTKTRNLLVTGLNECWPDFSLTSAELVEPTLDINIKYFERFLNESGIRSDLIIKVFSQNYEEYMMYEDIMYLYVVYACASRKYSLLNLSPNFAITLRNFLSPSDDKNFVTRLNLLSNSLFYCKMKDETLLQPLKMKMLEDVQVLDQMKSKVDVLNENLKSATVTEVLNEKKLAQVQKNNEVLFNTLYESERESEEFTKIMESLKAELNMFEQENDELTNNLENNLAKEEMLKAQIVDNHKTIISERIKIENQIQEDQEISNEYIRNLEVKTATESDVLKNYDAILNISENLSLTKQLNTYDLIDEIKTETEKILKEINLSRKAINEERNTTLSIKQEIKQLEEKFQNLEMHDADRFQDLDNEIAHLQNDKDELMNHLGKAKKKAAELIESYEYLINCSDKYKDAKEKQSAFYRKSVSRILVAKHNLDNTYVEIFRKY